jgi:CheY-like chemotaxis protein
MTADPPSAHPAPAVSILVVEDEASVRAMLSLALRSAGYAVHLAVDGLDAAEQLEGGLSVDLVLMDVRMPRLGGVELLARLRVQPGFGALPVIAMSAYSDALQEQEVLTAGANFFLPKPFTLADMRVALDAVLQRAAN